MRVAIVSPYSWTYPGGVNRHIESLGGQLLSQGHELRVLAPWDDSDRWNRLLHRNRPAVTAPPEYLVPLGRTIGIGANGSISNLAVTPEAVVKMRTELRAFQPDIVHVHEPSAPVLSWDACSFPDAPVVGTFHAYSTKALPNRAATLAGARRKFGQLSARIAVSEAAAWTGRRWFGGDYTIIPNGVDLADAQDEPGSDSDELRLIFVGRAETRKGLPVLLAAFEALADQLPTRLTVVGPSLQEISPYLGDDRILERIEVTGRVSHEELWRRLHGADVLCAPSLSGESFGMILTEAFAAGTPVVASNIAGYADVVTDGVDGVLVPPGDPQALAEELQNFYLQPERTAGMAAEARRSAERYAWPSVALRVGSVYEQVLTAPLPATAGQLAARRLGLPVAGLPPISRPQRLPSLDPPLAGPRRPLWRRFGLAISALVAIVLTGLAVQRIGLDSVVGSIVRSDQSLVLAATGLMAAAMLVRSLAWFAIARAAMPRARLHRLDFASATMVGVLMSATLPARLGEPARAVVAARRIGRVRDTLPIVLGTLVSQTVLNIVALLCLGVLVITGTELFDSGSRQLFAFSLAPFLLLLLVLLAPVFVRNRDGSGRLARFSKMVHSALIQVRSGLKVFGNPRLGAEATVFQLGAWALQLGSCVLLFAALGLDEQVPLVAASAAVLFAVNVTAVLPATPSNIGVFQLAVISVLSGGFGVSAADALAYGVILQAVEIATAVAMGVPALVREGVSWSDMRLRVMTSTPVRLEPRGYSGSTR